MPADKKPGNFQYPRCDCHIRGEFSIGTRRVFSGGTVEDGGFLVGCCFYCGPWSSPSSVTIKPAYEHFYFHGVK